MTCPLTLAADTLASGQIQLGMIAVAMALTVAAKKNIAVGSNHPPWASALQTFGSALSKRCAITHGNTT